VREGSRSVVAALTFLTAIPIGNRTPVRPRDLGSGALLFPVVGAGIGAIVAATAWVASFALPPFAAGVIGVGCGVVVTGALHLDGLADVADGVGASLSGSDPRDAMTDARLGVFGGAALVLDLVLKIAVVASLVADRTFPPEVIAAFAVARVAPLPLASALPYVGSNHGWASGAAPRTTVAPLLLACAIGIAAAGAPVVIAVVVVSAVATTMVGRWAAVRLKGTTGDVLGAVVELTETLGLSISLALR
jgi:adenosylcobinamide-GDP ribazoletransferase